MLDINPERQHPADDWIVARFVAPADTLIAGYRLYRSIGVADGYGWRYRELTPSGRRTYDSCTGPACAGLGDPSDPFGAPNLISAAGRTDVTGLELVPTCALDDASASTCPAQWPGARLELYGGEITLTDDSAPALAPPAGSLLDTSQALTGAQSVTVTATDKGGGVYQGLLEVDGRVVAAQTLDANGGACAPPFRGPVPCKLSASGTISLDTTALPDGAHSVRVLVSDATGTNLGAWGPVTIRTANASCNPDPLSSAGQRIVVRVRDRATRRVVRYGRAVRVSGRVLAATGAPLAGALVCVAARDASAGAPLRAYRVLTTDADGRFSYVLERGASRRVLFVHRESDGAIVKGISVRVRAPVRLRSSRRSLRNGQTLRLRGRLGAPPFPSRGVLVELQAKRTSGWQTFGTTRTNRRGRYRFDYTFSRTLGVQQYRLRARVPKQGIYPFEPGASRPVRVTVRG